MCGHAPLAVTPSRSDGFWGLITRAQCSRVGREGTVVWGTPGEGTVFTRPRSIHEANWPEPPGLDWSLADAIIGSLANNHTLSSA